MLRSRKNAAILVLFLFCAANVILCIFYTWIFYENAPDSWNILRANKGPFDTDMPLRDQVRKILFNTGNGGGLIPESPSSLLLLDAKEIEHKETNIPHIFHQYWDTPEVPEVFEAWIQSWIVHHPDWQYWFWTPSDVRKLISTHYTQYVELCDSLSDSQDLANVMRYFVIYHIGGVYIDLDMQSLKPMHNWTFAYHCFASEETYVHAYIEYHRDRSELMNTILACKPNHPFYNYTISRLKDFLDKKNSIYRTGPFFLDQVYIDYLVKYHRKHWDLAYEDLIIPIHPDYFLPTHDKSYRYNNYCKTSQSLNRYEKELCDIMQKSGFRNAAEPYSYAMHHWFHVKLKGQHWKDTVKLVDIQKIVPHAKVHPVF